MQHWANNCENASDAGSEPVTSIIRTHPEHDPAQHNKEDAWKVQLNHVCHS